MREIQNCFLYEGSCKFVAENFPQALAMSSPVIAAPTFGSNQTYNTERQTGSTGSFGVTSTPERYISREDDSAGVNMPENREPIYINR